jgi:hypothetical protein
LARSARVRLALTARLFPDYFAHPLGVGLDASLLARAIIGLEHLDANGGLRRLFGYGQLQLGYLLASPAWRSRFAMNIRSSDYRRYCLQRLRHKWKGH